MPASGWSPVSTSTVTTPPSLRGAPDSGSNLEKNDFNSSLLIYDLQGRQLESLANLELLVSDELFSSDDELLSSELESDSWAELWKPIFLINLLKFLLSDFIMILFFHFETSPSNDDSSYQLFNKEKLRNAREKQNSS